MPSKKAMELAENWYGSAVSKSRKMSLADRVDEAVRQVRLDETSASLLLSAER